MEEKKCSLYCDASIRKGILAVLIILSLFLLAKTIGEFKRVPNAGKENPIYNTISVSGKGEVVAIPELARVSFSVTSESLLVADAQKKVSDNVSEIISYLKENGIVEKDIKTTGYNLYPRYRYSKSYTYPYLETGKRTLVAYVVTENISLKIKDLTNAGKIIGGLGEFGASNVSGLEFGFENDDKMKAEARELAIKDAKEKARKLALDLGVSLGRVVDYNENRVMPYFAKELRVDRSKGSNLSSPNNVQLNLGENKISSSVNITYEIR